MKNVRIQNIILIINTRISRYNERYNNCSNGVARYCLSTVNLTVIYRKRKKERGTKIFFRFLSVLYHNINTIIDTYYPLNTKYDIYLDIYIFIRIIQKDSVDIFTL